MADPDWLSELSEALEADAERSASPGDEPELELSGSGRPLEGWADQLADAMDEDVGEGLEEAQPVPGWPDVAPQPSTPPAAVDPATIERLVRIEALLGADLDKLGPAVLAESVAAIETRVDIALERLAALDAPLATLEQRLTAHAATLSEPVRVQAVVPAELGELLSDLSMRFASLEALIAEVTVEPMPDELLTGAPAVDLEPLLVTLAAMQTRIEELATQRVAPAEAGEQLGVDLEPLVDAVVDQRDEIAALAASVAGVVDLRQSVGQLEVAVGELLTRAATPATPEVDLDPMVQAFGAHREYLGALRDVIAGLQGQVAELAARPAPEAAPAVDLDPMVQAFGEQRRDVAALTASIAGMAGLHDAIDQLQAQVAELAARAVTAPPPAVDLEPLVSAFGEQRGDVAALAEAVGGVAELHTSIAHLQAQMNELAARPAPVVPEPAPVDLEPVLAAVDSHRAELAVLAAAVSGVHQLRGSVDELQARLDELAARPAPVVPGVDLDPLVSAFGEQRREVAALAAALAGVRSPEPTDLGPLNASFDELRQLVSQLYAAIVDVAAKPAPPTDPEVVEALQHIYDTLVEQGGNTVGADQLHELSQSMARHQDGLTDRIDQAAAAWSPQISVPPESLLPVAKVIGDRIEEGRKADRATLEVLTSRVAAMEAAVAAAGKDDETAARLAKGISTLGSRLTSVEKRLADSGEIDEMIRQALGDLVVELETVRRTLMG